MIPYFGRPLLAVLFPILPMCCEAQAWRRVEATLDSTPRNPPTWPKSVQVFDVTMDMDAISAKLASLYAEQTIFSEGRAALLFKPGSYPIDVPVGYYTQVLGLGASPLEVSFTGQMGVHEAEPGENSVKFWRSVENVRNVPRSGKTVWSVSQASTLRRMAVDGDLQIGVQANTQGSGGYISGVQISEKLNFTMQQQWVVRNSKIADGVSWFTNPPRSVNFVFVGTEGAPHPTRNCTDSGSNPESPSPQILVADGESRWRDGRLVNIEKPYITIDSQGKYSLITPQMRWDAPSGTQWDAPSFVDGFERVFIATPDMHVAAINSKLAAGLHVVLTPGIYRLAEPIRIGRVGQSHQVLLGLGLATLVPQQGGSAIEVDHPEGVRIAGLLLEGGPKKSYALLRVGTSSSAADAANPCLIADVFARMIGVEYPVSADMMVEINASNVVIDNMWLWRGDVGKALDNRRDCWNGLVVNGDNVTAYGLAAEHTQSDNTVWNGEFGRVFFYQAELDSFAHKPEDDTPDYGPNGVSGYRVNALKHHLFGAGVYVYQLLPGVIVESGIKVLHAQTIKDFVCPFKWDFNSAWWAHHESTIEKAVSVVQPRVSLV